MCAIITAFSQSLSPTSSSAGPSSAGSEHRCGRRCRSHHVPPNQPISKRTAPMKRALVAALLLAAGFTTARAADKGMDGHDLLKHCRESALSEGTYRDTLGRAI